MDGFCYVSGADLYLHVLRHPTDICNSYKHFSALCRFLCPYTWNFYIWIHGNIKIIITFIYNVIHDMKSYLSKYSVMNMDQEPTVIYVEMGIPGIEMRGL